MSNDDAYVVDDATGNGWRLMLGDSCERLSELDDESVDLSVYSPPFASLYTYSPSLRDLGNSHDRDQFFDHYRFVIDHMLRLTKPGRLSCVHVMQLSTTKATHGVIGLTDFRGQVIAAHQAAGWIYYGEVTVDKDPQAQAIRTKAHCLMFQTLKRDSSGTRPALADYVLLFRKPGENAIPIKNDVDNETWIEWARPVWEGIRESDTLNGRRARDANDEKHIAPLQLPLIERCVRLWSNPGELVCSPFAGIGSEGFVALKHARRFVGCELKASYWSTAVENLRAAAEPTLFDAVDVDPEPMPGRRLPDCVFGEPGAGWDAWKDSRPGDYMKVDYDGKEVWWYIRDPWNRVGRLMTHTIIEHEDGTITVAPSIYDKDGGALTDDEIVRLREMGIQVVPGPGSDGWHGWLEQGVWRSV